MIYYEEKWQNHLILTYFHVCYCQCGCATVIKISVQQVNGAKTTIDKHPWVIVIKDENDKLHCGGAIASSNRVISAGHCFVDQVSKKEMTKSQKQKFKVQVGTDIPFEYKG